MGFRRRCLVALLFASLVLEASGGASTLVCRFLCLLEACPMTAPLGTAPLETAARAEPEGCCAGGAAEEPAQDEGQRDPTCPCARGPEHGPSTPVTSPVSDASPRLLLLAWVLERASAGSTPEPSNADRPWRAALRHGPAGPGGCLGTSGRLAFGGSWSASVLGCARI